jgi:hypothetical protein
MSRRLDAVIAAMCIYSTYGMGQIAHDLNEQRLDHQQQATQKNREAELLSNSTSTCSAAITPVHEKISSLVREASREQRISESYTAPRNVFIGIAAICTIPALALAFSYGNAAWPRGRKNSATRPT